MNEIGTVISSELGPSSQEFWFVVNDNKGVPVRKGQFIQLETSDGLLVARVDEIIKTNRYYQRAESVSEFEKSGKPLTDQFPVDRWEYLIAQAYPLGVFSNGLQRRVTFPVSPGNKIYPIDENILNDVLGLDVKNGINIGKVEFHNTDAKLNITRLFQKHLAVLAMSGAGKSYLTSVLIEELLNKERNSRPSVILIDPHGEYGGFVNDNRYATSTKVYHGEEITIATHSLSAYELSMLMPKITSVQRRELNPIIRKLRGERPVYNMQDLIDAVQNSDIKDIKTKTVLVAWLHELDYTKLFSNRDYPSVKDLAFQGNLSILNLSDLVDIRRKQIIIAYFAKKLFDARRQKKISPFILFVEEAHQFCLSSDTEILTQKGWKKYNELKVGYPVFSYNKDSDKLEVNPIQRLIIKNYSGELVKLYNDESINSLVTNDHRVLCYTRTTNKNHEFTWSQPKFILAKDLPTGFKIPITAKIQSNSKCNIDNDLIKIIGWIVTDGYKHLFDSGKYFSFEISQTKKNIVKQMIDVVKRRFPKARISSRKRKDHFYDSRFIKGNTEFTFYFGKECSDELKKWLGNNAHRIPRQLLENASIDQLKILFDALVQGDGNISYSKKNGYSYVTFYPGHDSYLADDFQELCVKLGFSAVKTKSTNGQIKVLVSFRRKFAFIRKVKKETYSGKVWDVTVKNGAFVARREGKIFITGNCPEGEERESALSRGIIDQIAREGRKFNACLVLITQRPAGLATTALSQCNTHVIMRVTNPYDLDHIKESSEGITGGVLDSIPGLKVGEAYIVGEAVNYPILVNVRERKSKSSEKGMKLEDEIQNFNDNKQISDKDLETFM
ncbi:MAG: DUF87 domain-containing protein [Candidatus Aenigmarchaeota archaeon]|nr:DUF87 domain-containing protein [Candidatus Aenigmarchaeota archaeon]